MARSTRQQQKALERHKAKRSLKHVAARGSGPDETRLMVRQAAAWPVRECLITRDWQTPGEIVQIVVARESSDGRILAASFLVDLGCLGVKNAFISPFSTWLEYRGNLRDPMEDRQEMAPTDLNTAARVIQESIAYARDLGFKPHRDFALASRLLEGADPNSSHVDVPLGLEGKPFFIAGPYDNVYHVVATLRKKVGDGNFSVFAPDHAGGALSAGFEDEDEADL